MEDVIFCGSLSIKHHLKKADADFDYNREFNDIDAVVSKTSSVKPTLTQVNLISHYHDYSNKEGHADDFYISTVDPELKVKTDFFSYRPYFPFEPVETEFEGFKVKIRNPEDQLATQIIESSGVFKGNSIDPKWLNNVKGLWKIANGVKVEEYFRKKENHSFKVPVMEIYNKILAYLMAHPEQLVSKTTRRKAYKCELCEDRNGFKVEPMQKIYDVLDYSEQI